MAAGPAQAQNTTWSTTTTTAPAAPGVSSRTVTTTVNPASVNPPPAVVVSPPAPGAVNTSETTETTSTTAAPMVPEVRHRGQALGAGGNRHTTIVFKAADRRDIDTKSLQSWDDFAQAHPSIAKTLAYKPELVDDAGYLRRHPDLDDFMAAHPDIKEAMVNDPGNFAAIPPRPGE